jgi:hypothetical protein
MSLCSFCFHTVDPHGQFILGHKPDATPHTDDACINKHNPINHIGNQNSALALVGGGAAGFVVGRSLPKACDFCHGAGHNLTAKPHHNHECTHPFNPNGVKAQKMAAAVAAFGGGVAGFVIGGNNPKVCDFCHGAGHNVTAKPHLNHECKHSANPKGLKAQQMAAAVAAFGGGVAGFVIGGNNPKVCDFCHGARQNVRAKPHLNHECKHPLNPKGLKAQQMAAAVAAFGASIGPQYGDIQGDQIWNGKGWRRILHTDMEKGILKYLRLDGVPRIIAFPIRR